MRVNGHALTVEWSGERGEESSSTGICKCGEWEESASNQREVRFEYREHLKSAARDEGQTRARHDAPDRWSRKD